MDNLKNRFIIKCFILGLTPTILCSGCATSVNARIDEKLSGEENISSVESLRTETKSIIEQDEALSENEKTALLAVQKESKRLRGELEKNSLKLREILISDILSPNFDRDEIEAIESRLRDNATKRLDILFNAVSAANKILGHKRPPTSRRIMGEVLEHEDHHHR